MGRVRDNRSLLSLTGIVLPDVSTGAPVALTELPGVQVLSLVRHRY